MSDFKMKTETDQWDSIVFGDKVTEMSETPTDSQIPTAKAVHDALTDFFDIIYPVGSYAFGVCPSIGTWEEVVGDRALWLKNTVDDGTTVSQALPAPPDIFIYNAGTHHHALPSAFSPDCGRSGWSEFAGTGAAANAGQTHDDGLHTHSASYQYSDVYGHGTKVQPDAYVMKVWKRTA